MPTPCPRTIPSHTPARIAAGAMPMLALALSATLTLAACGSSSASKAAQPPAGAPATAAPNPVTSNTVASNPGAPVTTVAARPTATVTVTTSGQSGTSDTGRTIDVRDLDFVSFASPSGRIQCTWADEDGRGSITCGVEGANWTPRAGTPACDLAIGDEASLDDTTAGELTCHGDTTLGTATVGQMGTNWTDRANATTASWHGQTVAAVPYGTMILLGNGMTCTSRRTGMSCSSRAGHGFTVAREDYSLV